LERGERGCQLRMREKGPAEEKSGQLLTSRGVGNGHGKKIGEGSLKWGNKGQTGDALESFWGRVHVRAGQEKRGQDCLEKRRLKAWSVFWVLLPGRNLGCGGARKSQGPKKEGLLRIMRSETLKKRKNQKKNTEEFTTEIAATKTVLKAGVEEEGENSRHTISPARPRKVRKKTP